MVSGSAATTADRSIIELTDRSFNRPAYFLENRNSAEISYTVSRDVRRLIRIFARRLLNLAYISPPFELFSLCIGGKCLDFRVYSCDRTMGI